MYDQEMRGIQPSAVLHSGQFRCRLSGFHAPPRQILKKQIQKFQNSQQF